MNTQSQRGDVMTVVMIVLVVLVLGALGYVAWQSYGDSAKDDTAIPREQQTQPEGNKGVPEGWAKQTDDTTGVSYAIPKDWDGESVVVKKYDVDTTIYPMKGPSAINAIRYDSKEAAWQVIDGPTGEKGDQSVIADIGKTQDGYEAIRYTGGDGMMSQTHLFIYKGDVVYQLALPRTTGDEKLKNEKVEKAAEVVKMITLR